MQNRNFHVEFYKKLHFPQWLYHFTSAVHTPSSFSTSSPTFDVVTIFYFSHSGRWAVTTWICISLMANEAGFLFMCLFPIHISSLVKCLFIFFAHFLIKLFYCWIFARSSYILDTSPLSNTQLAVFSLHSVTCLLMLLTGLSQNRSSAF